MKLRTVLLVFLALVFAGAAAMCVNLVANARTGSVDSVPVVVAVMDIPRGEGVNPANVKIRQYPKDLAPHGFIGKLEDAYKRAAITPLVKDEPILESKLASKEAGLGLAALVSNGMRAVTILVPNLSAGVGGFLLPGNHVDVVLTVESQGIGIAGDDNTGGGSATTLLQNVEVMAVDTKVDSSGETKNDPNQMRTVTLIVTPDQANQLALGQSRGKLHLTLRNTSDSSPAQTRTALLKDLRYHQDQPWDVRTKTVLETFGKLLERRSALASRITLPPPRAVPAPSVAATPTVATPQAASVFVREIKGSTQG